VLQDRIGQERLLKNLIFKLLRMRKQEVWCVRDVNATHNEVNAKPCHFTKLKLKLNTNTEKWTRIISEHACYYSAPKLLSFHPTLQNNKDHIA
jgi:hypothetical protein